MPHYIRHRRVKPDLEVQKRRKIQQETLTNVLHTSKHCSEVVDIVIFPVTDILENRITMDIESEEALVLLFVEDLINLRNLCLLLAYVYIKLVVQPRQHRRVRRRLRRASYSMSNRLPSQIEHIKLLVEISDRTCIEQLRIDRICFGHLVMESTASGGCNSQGNGQRRVWTRDEESALIQGLRDLVSRGWKCDNGFRSGYTNILEQHMAQCFPGTNIKAEPHILSKITVWKKNYGLILGMLATSGFEWSETGNMIVVKEDAVWQSYINVINSFPEQCDDLNNNMDSFSAQEGESSASGKSKRDGKRKHNVEVEDKIIGLISSVCEETNKRLSELSVRFTNQGDAKEQRIAVYEALKKIPNITTDEKVIVARYLCKNLDEMDLFFSLDDVAQCSMELGNIERRFRLEGWTEEEEEACNRLFFQKCAETDDVHLPAVVNSLWFGLFRQLSDLMQKEVSWMKGHYREFLQFMTTPGVGVHDDGSFISVNREYWNFVREETDIEQYFRWNGFKWYNECVQLWNLRGAAQVDIDLNPCQTLQNPIHMDVMEDDFEVEEQVESPIEDYPVPMDDDEELRENEFDVDSCVDSN
ncbi:aspartate carbamoyltransferase [Striga asiatica]|uniref:Aspartate carbamoyltransferase n=1 Tax=Striga asiatica TaxID=4170 RepID=A0A5A7QKG5_STRAF|nr:aspartate carbamoyltransferase [Striga asiatica]